MQIVLQFTEKYGNFPYEIYRNYSSKPYHYNSNVYGVC